MLIDGKKIAADIKCEIAAEVQKLTQAGHRPPKLAAILVGGNGASITYVANKERSCSEVGFASEVLRFPDTISESDLLGSVARLNTDSATDGFIVQLPLPAHISEQKVIDAILPNKDVDGFHPVNVGRMSVGMPSYLPATPAGIVELLRRYRIDTCGKHCVILGRSNIVGRPLSILLSQKEFNCTVTLCHSRTADIKNVCQQADILIAAMGVPEFVTADMVKQGAVVIDVGTTRIPSATSKSGFVLKGDVKFDEAAPKCSYITPVPGGVGPMTIVSLLKNTLTAYLTNHISITNSQEIWTLKQ
jgi:methylenetetrahydrofolate dehydrogenase (NADP+)/methenyltetrahydrofolate cyclohydrolase